MCPPLFKLTWEDGMCPPLFFYLFFHSFLPFHPYHRMDYLQIIHQTNHQIYQEIHL
jgi:hypothetical protein